MFDPYHRWLGIPKGERPPNHYQLLGVAPGESDSEVINEAAIMRSAHVRTYQLSAHAELCSHVLEEIAEARAVLLDPRRRSEYDRTLQARAGGSATLSTVKVAKRQAESDSAQTLASAELVETVRQSGPMRTGKRRAGTRRTAGVPLAVWFVGLAAVVVVAAAGAVVTLRRGAPAEDAPPAAKSPAGAANVANVDSFPKTLSVPVDREHLPEALNEWENLANVVDESMKTAPSEDVVGDAKYRSSGDLKKKLAQAAAAQRNRHDEPLRALTQWLGQLGAVATAYEQQFGEPISGPATAVDASGDSSMGQARAKAKFYREKMASHRATLARLQQAQRSLGADDPKAQREIATLAELETTVESLSPKPLGAPAATRARELLQSANGSLRSLAALALARQGDPAAALAARQLLSDPSLDDDDAARTAWALALGTDKNLAAEAIARLQARPTLIARLPQPALADAIDNDANRWRALLGEVIARGDKASAESAFRAACDLQDSASAKDLASRCLSGPLKDALDVVVGGILADGWREAYAHLPKLLAAAPKAQFDAVTTADLDKCAEASAAVAASLVEHLYSHGSEEQVDWAVAIHAQARAPLDDRELRNRWQRGARVGSAALASKFLARSEARALDAAEWLLANARDVAAADVRLDSIGKAALERPSLRRRLFDLAWGTDDIGKQWVLRQSLGESAMTELADLAGQHVQIDDCNDAMAQIWRQRPSGRLLLSTRTVQQALARFRTLRKAIPLKDYGPKADDVAKRLREVRGQSGPQLASMIQRLESHTALLRESAQLCSEWAADTDTLAVIASPAVREYDVPADLEKRLSGFEQRQKDLARRLTQSHGNVADLAGLVPGLVPEPEAATDAGGDVGNDVRKETARKPAGAVANKPTTTASCRTCNGTGKVQCTTCRGTRMKDCTNAGCRGGKVTQRVASSVADPFGSGIASQSRRVRSTCSACNGQGKMPCTFCDRDGKRPCPRCRGRG